MTRSFREHTLRTVIDLGGIWDFAFLGAVEEASLDVRAIRFDDRMVVPACFDATPRYAGKRGLAAYRRSLRVHAAGKYRLLVDGAHHHAEFFLDGQRRAAHSGGFTSFAVDLGQLAAGDYELLVLVDNRFDASRCPLHLEAFDWYHFGGLTRSLNLERLPAVHIERVVIRTASWRERQVVLTIHARAENLLSRLQLDIDVDATTLLREEIDVPQGTSCVERTLHLPGAKLWSPGAPALYELRVVLGDDDVCERFGIRQIETRDRQLLLNGEPLWLSGVNRHEAHPEFGHAVPSAVQLSDLQLIRALGCNFVRGSHYPQDRGFLDLCDELGILVWNEAIGWQHSEEHLCDEEFLSAQEMHIDEMIAMSVNHPSVVLWGLLNESCSWSERARPGYARLIRRIRQSDPSRPVTYATNRPHEDRCLDLVDVVSVNTYPGWYFGELDTIASELDALIGFLSDVQPNKPLLVGEIGAGALYGFRDHNRQRWTEEYQAELIARAIGALRPDPRVVGLCIWQFCDCRTPENARAIMGRPRGFNNKGLVDEYRRPKLAFAVAAAALARETRPSEG